MAQSRTNTAYPGPEYGIKMAAISVALASGSTEHPVFYEDEVDIHLNPKFGADWQLREQQKREKIATLENLGEYPAGMAIDTDKQRLYVVNGRNEMITVDTMTNKIVAHFSVEPTKKHFFLNIALDAENNRAFITDPDVADALVVDINNSKVITPIKVINSLAVIYNKKRQDVYISHRNAKLISIVDSKTYQVKKSISTTALPNSLALSVDANVLYVSVKQPEKLISEKDDYILKVDLSVYR